MRSQTKYLFIYLCVLCLLVVSVVQLAQAQENTTTDVMELEQAQLDQILAPIALYPDTLLSHILVASTYPLEVVQAARWRSANEDLDEQQALNAVEDKQWDPSVKALVPFNDLLQKLSEDLDWLQSLGSAFLVNEQQILSSVQNLRQKAYEEGNLNNNDYVNVEHDEGEIVIETVRKEVVYVPYYDTRVVYGNWWWHDRQPYYWHRPTHSIFSAGLYWSTGFNIRPRFYFGGFHWRNRHVVANYHYRKHADRYWSNNHNRRQVVRVKEYPRWSHNQQHRRGAQYSVNGQRIIRNYNKGNKHNSYQQINKQRVLNVNDYANKRNNNKHNKTKAQQFKQALGNQQQTSRKVKTFKADKLANNKQRIINQSENQHKQKRSNNYQPNRFAKVETNQRNSSKSQRDSTLQRQSNQQKRSTDNTQYKRSDYKSNNKSSNKSSSYRASSNKQNKSRPVKVVRQSKSKGKER